MLSRETQEMQTSTATMHYTDYCLVQLITITMTSYKLRV